MILILINFCQYFIIIIDEKNIHFAAHLFDILYERFWFEVYNIMENNVDNSIN